MKKTDKLSKYFLFFRKLTQISAISMVLELNYHKNSQRYIEFNFDHKNNYFQLKSEIVRKKVQNWWLIKPNHLEEGEVVTRFPYYPSWSFTKLNRNLWRVTLSKILFPNTGHWGIRFCPRVKFTSRIYPSAGSPTVRKPCYAVRKPCYDFSFL